MAVLTPVAIGDTIGADVRVTELRETSNPECALLTQRMELRNQREEAVCEGELDALVRRRQR